MKKMLSGLIVLTMVLGLVACSSSKSSTTEETKATDKIAGISMPTKTSQRWIDDGNNMVKSLEELGYKNRFTVC